MPASFMTLFPHVQNSLEALKIPIQGTAGLAETVTGLQSLGFGLWKENNHLAFQLLKLFLPLTTPVNEGDSERLCDIMHGGTESFLTLTEQNIHDNLGRFQRERLAELVFINVFTESVPSQDWEVEYDDSEVILDLPSLRLIDISSDVNHKIQNYGVVFAPRAGHHSNIAERVALYMRESGLTRMAIVEQKCAEDIPLHVDGERHYEGFDGQISQYRKVLEALKERTGYAPHLVAVCQPGPLLMSTLILYPHLGKTFGSAGSPMHTEAEPGYLTDFSRMMGDEYMDRLIDLLGYTVPEELPGAGRESWDGRMHVLGFYFLGMDQHFKNFRRLLSDLKHGNDEAAQRQISFYHWYNYVQHAPAGFIRDTYKRIFVKNELIKGTLSVHGRKIGIENYPESVPIWAMGGSRDDIAPPLQAIGHMDLLAGVPQKDKLKLICDGGHMGLFRSSRILNEYYSKIAAFILKHSDTKAS